MKRRSFVNLVFLIGIAQLMLFSACRMHYHLAQVEHENIQLSGEGDTEAFESMEAMIEPYRSQLDAKMNEVIGYAAKELRKTRVESTLGNWMADAVMHQLEDSNFSAPDVVILNYGGIRIPSLPEGEITVGKIYELMPFDNEVVILDLNYENMRKLLDHIADYGGWPCSKELKLTFKDGKTKYAAINEVEILEGSFYKVGLPDYIANGGDDCDFLKTAHRIQTGILVRDLLLSEVRYLNSNDMKVDSDLDSRMKKL